MLLTVDIGNTQTSFGIFKEGRLLHHWRFETKPSRTPDEYASFLFPLLQHSGITPNWDGIAICSVVPAADQSFQTFCIQYFNKPPFHVHYQSKLGFKLNVEVPHEVGADRLANAAYAIAKMSLPAIVVDLGTATTFDVITADKVYQGGIILPGVRMGADALSKRTSLLPLVDVHFPPSVIGKNTITCIQAGLLYGYQHAMEGLLEQLVNEIKQSCSVALTGGLSPMFNGKLKMPHVCVPDLTLEGIEILFKTNR